QPLFAALAEAERLARAGEEAAEVRYRTEADEATKTHKGEVRAAEKKYRKRLAEFLSERDDVLKAADDRLAKLTADFTASRDRELAKVEADYRARVAAVESRYERDRSELTAKAQPDPAEADGWHVR